MPEDFATKVTAYIKKLYMLTADCWSWYGNGETNYNQSMLTAECYNWYGNAVRNYNQSMLTAECWNWCGNAET